MPEKPSSEAPAEPYPDERYLAEHRAAGGSQLSRWLPLAALVVALIAVALAAFAVFRPAHSGPGPFNDEQTAGAKADICAAYLSVRQAVVSNTHLENPAPGNPIGGLAVAANARLALYGGGDYLRERLATEPATPDELAKAVGSMANTLEKLSIGYLSGAPDFAQQPLRTDLDAQIKQVNGLCK
jgi:hypothetical protein